MQKEKLSVKTSLPYEEAVAYMEDLLASLKSGKIVVQQDDAYVALTPGTQVNIEVEAKVKKGKQKFGFELTWQEGDSGHLRIGDTEPIAAPPAKKDEAQPPAAVEPGQVPATKAEASPPAVKAQKKTAKKAAPKKKAPKKAAKKAAPKKPKASKTGQ